MLKATSTQFKLQSPKGDEKYLRIKRKSSILKVKLVKNC